MKLEKLCPSRTFSTCAYACRKRGVVAFVPNISNSIKVRTLVVDTGIRKSRFMRVGRTDTVLVFAVVRVGMGKVDGMKLSALPSGFGSNMKSDLK